MAKLTLHIEGEDEELQQYLKAPDMAAFIFELKANMFRTWRRGTLPLKISDLVESKEDSEAGSQEKKQEIAFEVFYLIYNELMEELRERNLMEDD